MLHDYQIEIVKIILDRVKQNSKETFIEMATGTGIYKVIKEIIHKMPSSNILFLARGLPNNRLFREVKNVTVSFYPSTLKEDIYDIVILINTDYIDEAYYKLLRKNYSNALFISFCSSESHSKTWLQNKKMDYVLSAEKAIKRGLISPNITGYLFEKFAEIFLNQYDFTEILKDYSIKYHEYFFLTDFLLKKNNQKIIVEVKGYQSRFVKQSILNQAIEQVSHYNKIARKIFDEKVISILLVSCRVPSKEKLKYFNERDILIIDIANILYLIDNNKKLKDELSKCIYYDFENIEVEEPLLKDIFIAKEKNITNEEPVTIEKTISYIKKLEKLKPGKLDNNDKKYEKLCYDIIDYLFGSEFARVEKQNQTDEKMFQMDMICSLKGISDIWKIFLSYYRSRYVVFEFKNYSESIDQNLIYITEKYLFDAALRNVAFIISRKGFSPNALKAARGILTEHKKLILNINDTDLINMLRMKADGLDPSDYLLKIFDDYLMNISK